MSKIFRQMSDDDAKYAIAHREFSEELRKSGEYVAIVLTQSWCHQWHAVRSWLESPTEVANQPAVFYYEYDKSDLFDQFCDFKEQHWKNDQVPYIRYYHNGACVHESNYCSEEDFYRNFGL